MEFYHLKIEDKQTIFNALAERKGLPPAAIEKDWWVVQTLRLIFALPVSEHIVFKGGTSLSKAWNLIDRFSEDIDLALNRDFLGFADVKNRTQVCKLRDASFEYIAKSFYPDLECEFKKSGIVDIDISLERIKTTDQDPLVIEIRYPKVTDTAAYLSPKVLVEIGGRSLREPFTKKSIQSIVGETFADKPYADSIFTVATVNPERTFLEKLFLLHEEFQRPDEKIRLERLSRHLYDIHRISKSPFAKKAVRDHRLYKSIVEHRELFMKFGGVDYHSHFPPTLNPIPPDHLLPEWEKDYRVMQEQMIYGDSLPFNQLIEDIKRIVEEINQTKFE